jgi:hypothetical protein
MGIATADTMFAGARSSNSFGPRAWLLRCLRLVLMSFGLALVLSPLATLAEVASVAGGLMQFRTAMVCGSVALCLSLMIVGVAWIRYRPAVGIWLGGCSARGERSRSHGRSLHVAPMVSQSGFLSPAVFLFARDDAGPQRLATQDRESGTRIPCHCAGTQPFRFSPGSGPCGFKRLRARPPSSPGKMAAFRPRSTLEVKPAPWSRIWSGSNSAFRCGVFAAPQLETLSRRLPLFRDTHHGFEEPVW